MSKFKYPRLLILFFCLLLSVIFFYFGKTYPPFHDRLTSLGYFGTFVSGIFYAYGFTSAISTVALMILSKGQNILFAGLIAGLGALIGDILIYLLVKKSFMDEIDNLRQEKVMLWIKEKGTKALGSFYRYVMPVFAGILIASPLPTEIGVTIMSTFKKMSLKRFIIAAYLLHTMGIFFILLLGSVL